MTPDMKEIYAAVSVLLMLGSRGVYLTSIFSGRTRPHAFSWVIWSVISTIGFAAQVAEGAGPGSWARGVSAATCIICAVLGFTHGEKNITRADWITLVTALLAVPLWLLTETPVWSVILVCVIDTIGYLPTARKAYSKPHEETPRGYILSAFCALFSLLAISHYNLSTWLYPATLVITNALMAGYIISRKIALSSRTA